MKDTKLTLLQYNVQKSQSVQELLLATSALQEVDIIALQKLWKNSHLETVTALAQLHIWHKSHTLLGSPICTVACLLSCCLIPCL